MMTAMIINGGAMIAKRKAAFKNPEKWWYRQESQQLSVLRRLNNSGLFASRSNDKSNNSEDTNFPKELTSCFFLIPTSSQRIFEPIKIWKKIFANLSFIRNVTFLSLKSQLVNLWQSKYSLVNANLSTCLRCSNITIQICVDFPPLAKVWICQRVKWNGNVSKFQSKFSRLSNKC